MADKSASFAVELDASQVEDGAEDAASALEKMREKIEADQKALRDLQGAMGRLKGNSNEVAEAKKQLTERIKATKESLGQAQAGYIKGGGALDLIGKKSDAAGKASKVNAVAQGEAGKAMGDMAGKAGAGAAGAGRLAGALAKVGPYAAAAAAILAVTFGLALVALKFADAARSAHLANVAMTGSEAAGSKLDARIGALSKSLPMARAELDQIARALTDKGLQGGSLEYALSAVARTTAVLGQSAGAKIQAIAEKSKELKRFTAQALDFTGTGVTIDDVAKSLAKRTKTSLAAAKESIKAGAVDLATGLEALDNATKAKLGGAAAAMNLSLSSIFERGKSGFAGIFAGLNIEPVLKALSDIVGLLDSSSESGKALREIAKVALQPLIDFVGGQGSTVVGFFEKLVIGALIFAIMILKAKNAVKSFATNAKESITGVGDSLSSLGSNIIDGLVAGIKAGAAKVGKALKGVVDGAVQEAKEALGIASPSKVFALMGRQSMQGYEVGVEEAAPAAQKATAAAIAPQQQPQAAPSPAGQARGGNTYTFHLHGVPGADDPSFEQRVLGLLHRALVMSGEAVPLRPLGAT